MPAPQDKAYNCSKMRRVKAALKLRSLPRCPLEKTQNQSTICKHLVISARLTAGLRLKIFSVLFRRKPCSQAPSHARSYLCKSAPAYTSAQEHDLAEVGNTIAVYSCAATTHLKHIRCSFLFVCFSDSLRWASPTGRTTILKMLRHKMAPA